MTMERICAIIVTYFPDIPKLRSLLESLQDQVDQVILVENSDQSLDTGEKDCFEIPVIIFRNQTNVGIAQAHNRGVRQAWKLGCTHVLLLDQDSSPEQDMVMKLLWREQRCLAQGLRLAAIGPKVLAADTDQEEPLLYIGRWWAKTGFCQKSPTRMVSYLIASGSLIRIEVFEQIGLFDETFFIDLVDIEWGFRATQSGFSLLVCCEARLSHTIGSRETFLPGIGITRHAPERLYYQFRNFILLLRRFYSIFPGWFHYHGLRRLLPRFFLFMIISPRRRNLKMMLRGISDGLKSSSSGMATDRKSSSLTE